MNTYREQVPKEPLASNLAQIARPLGGIAPAPAPTNEETGVAGD